jgi:hypothetical protein
MTSLSNRPVDLPGLFFDKMLGKNSESLCAMPLVVNKARCVIGLLLDTSPASRSLSKATL